MLHERTTIAFLYLLQAGLWEREHLVPAIFPLSDQEWQLIYKQSIQQTVEGIVYDGIQNLPPSQRPPRSLALKWLVRIEHIERRNTAMNQIIAAQYLFFKKHQIEPILLKGQGMAQYYPQPLHRICGDIDWYFPTKKMYRQANSLIEKRGLELVYTAGYSSSYNWDHFETEHHLHIFDIHNPFCIPFLKRLLLQEKENTRYSMINDVAVALPAHHVNMVQVTSHILKHLLSFGIGIRQLCDTARLYHVVKTDIDPHEIKKIYHQLGIERWIDQLHHVLVHHIGLPKTDLPYPLSNKNADWLMEDILVSGNFGFHDSRYSQAEQQNKGNRVETKNRLWHRFNTYLPFAPMEAISFPIVQFLSKFSR